MRQNVPCRSRGINGDGTNCRSPAKVARVRLKSLKYLLAVFLRKSELRIRSSDRLVVELKAIRSGRVHIPEVRIQEKSHFLSSLFLLLLVN